MEILNILLNFFINNLVGIVAGAVFGWVIPQPSWANKFVSFVAPYINKAFVFGKSLVERFKNRE